MKTLRYFTLYLLAVIFLMVQGCKKDNEEQFPVSFSIGTTIASENNSWELKSASTIDLSNAFSGLFAVDPTTVTHVRLGIDGTYENPTISHTLPYSVSQGITSQIMLGYGAHTLVLCQLLMESPTEPGTYTVLFSAVAVGAELEGYVNTHVPLTFNVPLAANETVHIDVLAVEDFTPSQFGFAEFSIGITNLYPMYFFGQTDEGATSIMTMEIYDGTTLLGSSITDVANGWISVYVPDRYDIDNTVETYQFVLTKDGIVYSRFWTIAEIYALPQEVHLFNVAPLMDMMGFVVSQPIEYTINFNLDATGRTQEQGIYVGFNVVQNSETVFTSLPLVYAGYGVSGPTTGLLRYYDNPLTDDAVETVTIHAEWFYPDPSFPMSWIMDPLGTRDITTTVAVLKTYTETVTLQQYEVSPNAPITGWLF